MLLPCLILYCFGITAGSSDFKNKLVSRKLSAETHVLRIETEITAEHTGNAGTLEYTYLVDKHLQDQLAYIEAKSDVKKLQIKPVKAVQGSRAFSISLPSAKAGPKIKFVVKTTFSRAISARPAEITQAEKQYVQFTANILYLSAYPTEKQETLVVLPKGEVLAYEEQPGPVKKSQRGITYGPYENKSAFSEVLGQFNYENGSPFLAITSLKRTIEISLWGNVAVEDRVDIFHYGAALRGAFSRLDYQRGIGHHASVPALKSVLPASARDIYYRDEIGNISTSTVKKLYDSTEVELQPRFPLFGGWKTHYVIGYNLPAHETLFRKGEKFALKMRFVDYLYDDQVIDEMTLRVILPETVTNVRLESPFEVERLLDEVEKTYLDTSGRTVVVVKKMNLVEEHIQEFKVYFDFHMVNLFREPAMVITAFFLLFVVIMVYVRLDFSISKDKSSELQLRVQALVNEVLSCHSKRSALYQTYEDVVSTYKVNKENSQFSNEYRKVESDHKALNQKLSTLHAKIRELWSEGADKVQELQNLDSRYRELLQEGVSQTERVLSGKITKQQYQTSDADIGAKKVSLIEKMEAIMESL
uniref:Dolichyl-diphosphooligosaccharide--protein glycosyltransferase subunit 1 n=2 Tax=Schistocephalus solidus TaxID=70667 RepID=A0A0X3PUL8_SCHSO